MRWPVGIAAGIVLTAVFALPAYAGDGPDSRLGDTLLGKSDGVAYVSDPEFAAGASSIDSLAACPDVPTGKWRVVSGGYMLDGGADANQLLASSAMGDLDDIHGDNDLVRDDHWRVSANVSLGTTLTSYAICTKWDGIRWKSKAVPNSPSGERKHKGTCSSGLISGGGGGISTSNSYMSSMFPKSKRKWRIAAYDTIGGIGAMNNYFVCVPNRQFQIVKDTVSVGAGTSSPDLSVECFPDQVVVGGGVKTSGAPGTLSLRTSRPYDADDADLIPDDGWEGRAFSTDAGTQFITVAAICVG